MNTVRSCFAATIACIVVAIGWWAADAVVCCNSSSVLSGRRGVIASCRNKNRVFHTVETIGGGTCDDDRTAVPFWKCCPPGRPYDPEVRLCGPAREDNVEYQRRMMQRLPDAFRAAANASMVGYYYKQPKCDDTQVLVDVPAKETVVLLMVDPWAVELPQSYCFDLTPSDELVARTCQPRNQYCGVGGYMCVNKCCDSDQIIDFDEDGPYCKQGEMPFKLSDYEIDVERLSVARSNGTVLMNFNNYISCHKNVVLKGKFMLTTDGSHYRPLRGHGLHIPDTNFCMEYNAKAGSPKASGQLATICKGNTDDTENRGITWLGLVFRTLYVTSEVWLALTLFVYAKPSYLRNAHCYYIMCYLACLFMVFVCKIINMTIWDVINTPLCIPFDYFLLFGYLTSNCWLNVICFDIYWTFRYNISINRNTSISLRTIMYHIYCWGFSSICVSTIYLSEHSPHDAQQKLAPVFEPKCLRFDSTLYGRLIFYLLLSSVMLTANLILFLLTAIHCSIIKSELNEFRINDSQIESFLVYKERFVTSIKLFIVMGIPTSFSNQIFLLLNFIPELSFTIIIFLAIDLLQGVFVFIIFVAKRKVITDLRKMFNREKVHGKSSTDDRQLTPLNTISGSS